MNPADLSADALATLDQRVRKTMSHFRDVLTSTGRPELAAAVPWLDSGNPDSPSPADTAKLYSTAFQLLDMVEEQLALHTRHLRESRFGPAAEPGLWGNTLDTLVRDGFSQSEIAAALSSVRVEPVITAHPTEAKRPSVRERHRDVYDALLALSQPHLTPTKQDHARDRFLDALESMWLTGEVHVDPPTVQRELRNALFYLREVFPNALEKTHRDLSARWGDAGFDPAKFRAPRTSFGLWIGGDRDGHPYVTTGVTRDTLADLRHHALKLHRRSLTKIAHHLTAPNTTTPQMAARAADLAASLGEAGAEILARNPSEHFRAFAYLLRSSLYHDTTPDSLRADLEILHHALESSGAHRLAARFVAPLLRQLDIFGFHLAELDVRQNSAYHDQAVAGVLTAAGVADGENFASWPEDRRVGFLTARLAGNRPLLGDAASGLGEHATATLDCHRVLAEQHKKHGAGLGALVVSMTRQLSDLLAVHFLAREAGLDDGSGCPLPVVPLFETLDDLHHAHSIVAAYLAHPVAAGKTDLQVMLGYSDSNKDGGILASQAALHHAGTTITAAAEKHGVRIRFFHGRGGTISRGAGPTAWFLRNLPHSSLTGDFRMTEQGETIARKYANLPDATYHLEALQASTALTTALHSRPQKRTDPAIALLPGLAETSRATYRGLLESEDFLSFFRAATPIDALEHAQIGSRPSRRTGTATLDDLRAIPWVFSWTQSRFYLPGWFGVGTALGQLEDQDPQAYATLAAAARVSIFARYVFTNVETNLASASLDLMESYASLVPDPHIRASFLGRIRDEFVTTRTHIANLFPKPLALRRPRFAKTLALRQRPLHTLHLQQVGLLRDWRETGGDLPHDLLLNINAISSGLRNTG